MFAFCNKSNAQNYPMVPNTSPGVQANLNADSDPTTSQDLTKGYSIGSLWQNSSTGRIWVARSVTTNAAVWTLLEFSDHPGYIAGNWYLPHLIVATSNGQAPGAGSIRLIPGYVKERITVGGLGVDVTTLFAGGNVQAAIYANNPATGRPTGLPLASTSSMSTAVTGVVNSTVSVQLEPGLYWFATNSDNATSAYMANGSTSPSLSIWQGSSSLLTTAGMLSGLTVAQTFGTWPSLTSASFSELSTSQRIPLVFFNVSSVP